MPTYDRTLSSAKAFSEVKELDLWIHQYLRTDGHNIPYSDGLHLAERYFIGPIRMPLRFFHRDCGPEPEEYEEFMDRYGSYVIDTVTIRRK